VSRPELSRQSLPLEAANQEDPDRRDPVVTCRAKTANSIIVNQLTKVEVLAAAPAAAEEAVEALPVAEQDQEVLAAAPAVAEEAAVALPVAELEQEAVASEEFSPV